MVGHQDAASAIGLHSPSVKLLYSNDCIFTFYTSYLVYTLIPNISNGAVATLPSCPMFLYGTTTYNVMPSSTAYNIYLGQDVLTLKCERLMIFAHSCIIFSIHVAKMVYKAKLLQIAMLH